VVVEDAPRLAQGPLAEALGMGLGDAPSSPVRVKCLDPDHPATIGVPLDTWRLPAPAAAPQVSGAKVILASADGWPVLWVRSVGKGKAVGLAGQRSQWRVAAQAVGYDGLLALVLAAADRAPNAHLAEISGRCAFRAWMYLGLATGQALHLLRVDVPQDYDMVREQALSAWRLAPSKPAEALKLAASAARGCEGLSEWAAAYWRKVPVGPLRKAGARQELLLCPGTLGFIHCMNLSSGAPAAGTAMPALGSEMWADEMADSPPGPATGYWRGLRPLLALTAELPLSVNPRLQQKRLDGSALWRPCWSEPALQALLADSVPPVRGDTYVFYSRGQPWMTASCDPDGDYSPAGLAAFRRIAEERGVPAESAAEAPAEWEPTPRWRAWQEARAEQARVRWKVLGEAVDGHSPSAILAVDAGYLCDPLYAGLGPETGAGHVDCLAPVVLANYEAGFDPGDLLAEVRMLASIADRNADGVADRWPGCVARFRWGDALSMPPEAHELIGAIALAGGAQGIVQTVAETAGTDDATATVPEDVYLRWEASFASAVRGHDLWLEARPQCDAVVWQSFDSACMARPADKAERAAGVRSSRWAATLARLGYVPRFVFDADVEAGRLGDARALVVPSVLGAGDKTREAIGAFARGGGTVLLGPGALSFDAFHRPLEAKPDFLSGVSLSAPDGLTQVVELTAKGALRAAVASPGSGVGRSLREGGRVTAWAWEVGKGKVAYFSDDAAEPAALSWLDELLGAGAPTGSTRPAVVCSGGARGVLMRLAEGRWLALIYNAGGVGAQSALPKVEASLAVGGGAWDVRELRPTGPLRRGALQPAQVQATASGGRLGLLTSLAPHQYRLFLLASR